MRAALDDLAASASGRRVAVLGDMLELGPGEVAYHEEIGALATTAGVDLLVTVGPLAAHIGAAFAGGTHRHVDDAARRRGAAPGPARARRHRPRQGLAGRRPRGRRPGARDRDGRLMGEVLIAGTAALLICIFLSPKFIAFLRAREFGQFIREEGPEGHHEKAGTPTMGGIIIFAAVSIPFLILSDYDWRSVGVFGAAIACAVLGFADDYTKIVKRRSLGLRARTKLGVTIAISIGLWWIATHEARPRRHVPPALARRHDRPRRLLPGADLPRRRGHDERGEPHGRPRRPRRRMRGDRPARLHRHHVHHDRPVGPLAARRVPRRRVRRVPVVQRVPGDDLHGRHRLARASAARSPASP